MKPDYDSALAHLDATIVTVSGQLAAATDPNTIAQLAGVLNGLINTYALVATVSQSQIRISLDMRKL